MKKFIMFFFFLLIPLTVESLEISSGSLNQNYSGIKNVSSLILTGTMDARDFRFIRDSLQVNYLDISGITITQWSGKYGTISNCNILYPANTIPQGAFEIDTNLLSIILPNNILVIDTQAFEGTSLTSIIIPESVKSIGVSSFLDCNSLTSISIPNSVTSVKGAAFMHCYSLQSVVLGSGLTSIGSSAFNSDNVVSVVNNSSLNVTNLFPDVTSDIKEVNVSAPPKIYYDLRGNRCIPEKGVYICIQGNVTTKVLINK